MRKCWKNDCECSLGALLKKTEKRKGFGAKHTAACYDRRNTNIMTAWPSESERHFTANGIEKINLWFQSICDAEASWPARTKQQRWEGVNVITWSASKRWQIFGERNPMCSAVGPLSRLVLWKQRGSWMGKEKRIHSGTCTHASMHAHVRAHAQTRMHRLPLSCCESL